MIARILLLACGLVAAATPLPVKSSSEFTDLKPTFSTSFVQPGSWIVVTASETVEPPVRNVIKSDHFCGLKPGYFVTVASVDRDKKSAQKNLDRLKLEKKTGYLRNVGAWSNRKPCKDSARTNSWHFHWEGGEIWSLFGQNEPIHINQKSLAEDPDGAKMSGIEIFEVSPKMVLLHAQTELESSDEPALQDHLILGLDGQGNEKFRLTFSVGDDYSDAHCEIKRSKTGEVYILQGNPTGKRTALRHNPTSGAFDKVFEVAKP